MTKQFSAVERFYLTDDQMKSMTEQIITALHGVPVGQAQIILQKAEKAICDCLLVDVTHPRFQEWQALDSSSL